MVTMRITAALSAAALGGLLAACSADPPQLTLAADDVAVCTPYTEGSTTYIGMPVTNTAEVDLTVTDLSWSQENVDSVEFLVDVAASDLDQMIGTMAWPTDQPLGYEEDILDRAVPVKGAVIPAGTTVDLLVAIAPSSQMWNAEVTDIALAYGQDSEGGDVVNSGMTMVVATELGCDAAQ